MHFTYNSSTLVGSEFGGTWEDPGGGFIKFAVKRALKQDQIVHMEGNFKSFATSAGNVICISIVISRTT